jgi:hypothetical protein
MRAFYEHEQKHEVKTGPGDGNASSLFQEVLEGDCKLRGEKEPPET